MVVVVVVALAVAVAVVVVVVVVAVVTRALLRLACWLAGWLAGVLSPRAASVLDRLLATSPAWAHLVPCRCGAAAIVLQYIQASVPALLRAQRSWGS